MTFIHWAGGKGQLLPVLSELFPPMKEVKAYCEPFLGGGSVFFYLERMGHLTNKQVYLSDINPQLIMSYKMVRNNLNELISLLTKYQNNHNEKLFYYVRDNFHNTQDRLEVAAQFIYLTRTGFNGLWRVNSKGINNMSIGSNGLKENISIFDNENMNRCSKALKYAHIDNMSFEKIIEVIESDNSICKKEWFCYIDPPYDNIGEAGTESFVGYAADGFKSRRNCLPYVFKKLDKLGCKVMMSNSSTPWLMAQFKDYYITTVKAKRQCAGKAKDRTPVDEIVVTNYKPVKKQHSLEDY